MGNFLSLSAVVGKNEIEVVNSLKNYTKSVGGGLLKEDKITIDENNCCIVEEANNNTSIFYPYGFFERNNSSEYISKELNTTVFSLHIHDSDLWMYILFHDGHIVDKFNPIPDYWDDNLSDEEINSWKGNAQTIINYISLITIKEIDKYLVRWDLEEEEISKAYSSDKYGKDEWQMLDFMNKIKLPYPIDEEGKPKGQTYKFWTKKLKLEKKWE